MPKITFKAKIIADISADPQLADKYHETSLEHLRKLLVADKCAVEYVESYSADGEPTLIITETK